MPISASWQTYHAGPATRAGCSKRVKKEKGNMERIYQTNGNARTERSKVTLDRRYGDIGISAVAAAVQCKGEEREHSVREAAILVLAETD
jgi:hypothetical protein